MIRIPHAVAPSRIAGAGQGLFTRTACTAGTVLMFPNEMHETLDRAAFLALPEGAPELASCVRWFADCYTLDREWSVEAYLNHSFSPNCLWHLGFIFAARDLDEDEELTIDYRLILDEGVTLDFVDGATGKPITGLSWQESMQRSASALARLFAQVS